MNYDDTAFVAIAKNSLPGQTEISLKDFFAGCALIGLLSKWELLHKDTRCMHIEKYVNTSYKIAKAMMEQKINE